MLGAEKGHRIINKIEHAALGALVIAGSWAAYNSIDGKPAPNVGAHGQVEKILPVDLSCRAYEEIGVRTVVRQTFHTPFDRSPIVGPVLQFLESTNQNTSIFTSNNPQDPGKGNGQINQLFCVNSLYEHVSGTKISVNASKITVYPQIAENKSVVIPNDGNGAEIGRTELAVLAPIDRKAYKEVMFHRAQLNTYAREVAVNDAVNNCAKASWPLLKKVLVSAYDQNTKVQYAQEEEAGKKLAPFTNPSVQFIGKPNFTNEYHSIPSNVWSSSDVATCNVAPNAVAAS